MKWFDNPQTLEDLKKQYKRLAMVHHPDRGGDTKPYKDDLKRLRFRWSQSKRAWYYHSNPYRKRSSKTLTLDEIRSLYGSETVKSDPPLKMKIV